jgi:hypothetical protein
VHGSVYVTASTKVGEATHYAATQIFLPDVEVYLHNTSTGTAGVPVKTDYHGRYLFPRQPAGTYELRWKAQLGWAAGHGTSPIVVSSGPEYPLPVAVEPLKSNGVVFGRATFADGGSTWFYDEFFGENRTAEVTLRNFARNATLQGPVHANDMGYFAVAGAPRGQDATLVARTEAATVTRVVAASAVSFGGPVVETDLSLANHRPQVLDVVVQSGGVPVKTAPAGSTVQLEVVARDADGDTLTYQWKTLPSQGTLGSSSGALVAWTLPSTVGPAFVYVEVSDGRGGRGVHRVDFDVGKTTETFSGRTVDKTSGAPVAGASVSVNGVTTTTDANGFFEVHSPLVRRYVFNVSKSGYALLSRVVDRSETGQTWRLVGAQKETVDPTQAITLIDSRPVLEKQRRKGAVVHVPANALVDASGGRPSGPLTAYLATFDVADGETPGDWGAVDGGKELNLVSYGAGFVEFVDAAGTKYNLAKGAQAEIEMTLPASMAAAAPSTIPVWSYDESDGYWKKTGDGTAIPSSGVFHGKVSHFSAFNTDLALTDAACLKVLLYPPLPTGVRLRMTDPTGVAFTQTFDFVLDRPLRGIYRVPANTNVHLQLFDPNGNEFQNLQIEETPGVGLPGNVVNSGPPIPAGQTLWPDEPYDTCKLVILRLVAPGAGQPDPSVFLTYKDIGDPTNAQAYYDAVDPNGLRTTLGGWWSANGFTLGADGWPTNGVRTSYLNDNDLGSGRDMYFRDLGGGNLAAFVTNYGQFNQDPHNADLAAGKSGPGATVCMEYSPIEAHGATPQSQPIVKFFVFAGNGGQQSASRATSADLDGFGQKYVPNLCLNCHGGNYSPSTPLTFADVDMRANFRELDTATYKFPGGRTTPNSTEDAQFRQQNQLIAAAGSHVTTQAIRDLIAGWYAGPGGEDNTWTPSGWSGNPQQGLYHDVVKRSCRTCHVALDDGTTQDKLDWVTYDQLKLRHDFLKSIVLCSGRLMPHAVVTYRNFWLSGSPHRPGVLRTYTDGSAWTALGDCQ